MDISAAKARVFPPVGHCIYCGGDGGVLPYRKAIGLIRHPNDLPAAVPLTLDLELQGPTQIALEMQPNVVVLPGLHELPAILTGRPPEPMVQFVYKIFGRFDILDETKRRLQEQQVVGIYLDGYAWLRMLAKIAHGYAIAELGLTRFSPALPDLILGRNPLLSSYLIGKCPAPPSVPMTRHC